MINGLIYKKKRGTTFFLDKKTKNNNGSLCERLTTKRIGEWKGACAEIHNTIKPQTISTREGRNIESNDGTITRNSQ